MKRKLLCRGEKREKFILFFAFCVLSLAFPASLGAQSQQRITLELKQVTIEQAILRIEASSAYGFAYKAGTLPSTLHDYAFRNSTIAEVMDKLLQGTNHAWTRSGNIITIAARPAAASQTATPVKGRVSDQSGDPLIGATVQVKGTAMGAVTDVAGSFSLRIPVGATLMVSYIGKTTKEIVYNGQQNLNVIIEDSSAEVGQVIVTGIFDKPKESFTGSVTTITAKELETFRGQNLIRTLGNIDPSINIFGNNALGSNPNVIPQMNIRGNSTLPMNVEEYNATQKNAVNAPIIIMDGFEITLTRLMDYNDYDIQSINILKDAAATAFYGSRGANGVIVIISKSPQPGRLNIQVNAGWDIEMPDLSSYDLLNARELLDLQYNLGVYDRDIENAYDRVRQTYEKRLKDVIEGINTDWLHYPVRTGLSHRYNARLEGGSEEFRWGASVGYKMIEGVMKDSKRNNFNGALTLAYTYKNIVFRNQLSIALNKAVESPYGNFSDYAALPRYFKPYDDNGVLVPSFEEQFYNFGKPLSNPLYDATLNTINESRYTEIINNFSIEWHLTEDLYLRGRLGLSHKDSETDYFLPPSHSKFTAAEYQGDTGFFRRGSYDYSTGKDMSYEGSLTLNYAKTFNEKHQLHAGLDFSMQENANRLYKIEVEGFSNDNANFFGNAAQYLQGGIPFGSEETKRSVGLTANATYTYNSRYYVDASYRFDGNSQYGSSSRFAPFWSVGAGWSLHNEAFLKDNAVINSLRLRLSYGITGSQNFPAYQAQATYRYFQNDKYLNSSGAYLIGIGNPELRWQTTNKFNVGVETEVLNNRLSVKFDYYNNTTYGLLSTMGLPLSTGYDSYVANIGEVRNSGFETQLTAYVVRNNDWIWTVGGTLVYNKNEILKLSESIKEQTEKYREQNVKVSKLFYEGYSQNSIWAVKSLGIDPSTGEELFLDKDGNITTTWNAGAKVYCGIDEPLYRGNLNSMLRYRNFTLNLSFAYFWGGQVYNSTLLNKVEVTNDVISVKNVDRRVYTARWTNPGDQVFFRGYSNTATNQTSRFVMDDNVFHLQSASLQYRISDAKFLQKMKMQSMTVSANMSDLFYLSSVKRERGTTYPFARRVGISLAFQF